MPIKSKRRMVAWFWLSAAVVMLDQLTKAAAEWWLQPYQAVEILPLFNLTLMYNTGAAFSFLSDAGGWQRWFFLTLTIIVIVVLIRWLRELDPAEKWKAACYALIIGGAIGNMIDRVATGRVVDFLDFYVGTYHWPAFNIADSALVIGVGALIWDMLMDARREKSA